MSLNIPEEVYNQAKIGARGAYVYLKGAFDQTKPNEFLFPFFTNLHEQIVENSLKEIELDMYELTFINSEAIKEIINWATKLLTLPPENSYRIKIVLNKEHEWQEERIKMIELVCKDFITKEFK